MRKIERELKREFPDARIEMTKGDHIRIVLANGKSVFTAGRQEIDAGYETSGPWSGGWRGKINIP